MPSQPQVAKPEVAQPAVAQPAVAQPATVPLVPVAQSPAVAVAPPATDINGNAIPAPGAGEQAFLIIHHGVGPFRKDQVVPKSAFLAYNKFANFEFMIGQGAIAPLPTAE